MGIRVELAGGRREAWWDCADAWVWSMALSGLCHARSDAAHEPCFMRSERSRLDI